VAGPFHGPLVSCETLAESLGRPDWVVFDCRYDLADREKGLREYGKGHVPGAYFAHVDRDLSGPVGDGRRGRHPLPIPGAFQRFLGNHGVGPQTQVVCYDDAAGQWASRLWWLARHYGHPNVAVLDGGLARWKALRLPLRAGHEKPRASVPFKGQPGSMPTVEAEQVATGSLTLLDARAPERFRGEAEPVDKRAGHIPGARNHPFAGNVGPDQRLLPPAELRARFEALGVARADGVACYCGSGVTGTHNVLAMEVAGLGTPALYPGSWSEWSWPEAGRPIETGPAPARAVP
jgi:thiosulfate/3-mercaptopyruvate sulfurtransferase